MSTDTTEKRIIFPRLYLRIRNRKTKRFWTPL